MSAIGKNIKKIRSAKKLSQAQFAELFNLTRGSVGAYEEGRAEPKIDTIIQIANYFSLSIDLLLTKEMTVTDLFNLDVFKEKLDAAHSFPQSATTQPRKGGIGLVRIKDQLEYIVNHHNKDFLTNLPKIDLPLEVKGTARAFELYGSEMEYNQNGLHHGDILLCKLEKARPKVGHVFVTVTKSEIVTRRLKEVKNQQLVLIGDDPNYPDLLLPEVDILELWHVRGVYSTYLNPPKMIENRVMLLEKRLEELEKRLT